MALFWFRLGRCVVLERWVFYRYRVRRESGIRVALTKHDAGTGYIYIDGGAVPKYVVLCPRRRRASGNIALARRDHTRPDILLRVFQHNLDDKIYTKFTTRVVMKYQTNVQTIKHTPV